MCHYPYLVAQLVRNLPSVQETGVQSLGWEEPPEKEMAPTPVFLPGESHGQRSLAGSMGSQESERLSGHPTPFKNVKPPLEP